MGSNSIAEIAAYHNDVVDSLKSYFFGRRPEDLVARLEETDLRSAFFILTTLEAAFRVDYLCRCQKRKKDVVSKAFCVIYKSQRKMRGWTRTFSRPGRKSRLHRDLD
jgi:hypothetical protein